VAVILAMASAAGAGWIWRGAITPVENPLANAKFARFTDFEGIERDAAISPDGKFVAFVSDRDGPIRHLDKPGGDWALCQSHARQRSEPG